MKNKILSIVLAVALIASLVVGASVAYLQDTDSDVNVMTVGNVYIEQNEYERATNADGSYKTEIINGVTSYVLQDFTQAKPLLPSAIPTNGPGWGWDTTLVDMSQVGSKGTVQVFKAGSNAQDKIITVKNTGKSDAYVRTWIALEDPFTENRLGINVGSSAYYTQTPWTTVEIDGVKYSVSCFTYKEALKPGEVSTPSLFQVYLNSKATNEDMELLGDTYEILAFSQAVQAAGFDSADVALNAAFGANHPWANGANIPVIVTSTADMKAALEAGEKDIVVKGATISENPFNGRYYKDTNIDFVDCTFTTNMSWMYINDVTFTNCTFDCGKANAAVHYDELFGDAVFNNCKFISGKIQIGKNGDGMIIFNDCEFAATTQTHSIWTEMGIRVYKNTEFNNCEFNNRVVCAGFNGQPVTFNNCTMNGGCPVYYVDNTDGIIRGGNIPAVTINNEKDSINVTTAAELEEAFASAVDGDIITLANDITGDVKLTQKADVKVTIYGNGKTYTGVMTVFGNGRKLTAGLTIKDINFVAANGAGSCIVSPDRDINNAYSYSSNVTVERCTFTDPDGVVNCAAVRHQDGGDSNWKIIDCVVDSTMHSLVQVNNVEYDGLLIQGCKVYSKNGINLNQCTKVSIIDCEIDVKGYAVRYGVAGATVNGTFEIKDSTLKSANDDGDAVIIFRGEMSGSTLTITNTTLTGSPEITGNANVVR